MEALYGEDLLCGYHGRPVIEVARVSVGKGHLLFLLGPVGSGKTTLLRCMLGALRPMRGRVLVEGKDVHNLSPRERARIIAYVPQHSPRAGLRVLEAVLLGRYPYRGFSGPTREDEEKAWRVLEELGLSALAERRLAELSGGQLQKVMLARALVQEPRVLLLDEPTSSLDLRARHEVMQLVRSVAASRGLAAIIASHDIDLAAHYGDYFVMIRDGEVIAQGGREALNEENVSRTYGLRVEIIWRRGRPLVVPVM